LGDFVPDTGKTPEEAAMQEALVSDINAVISMLSDKEADVLRRRFGLNNTKPQTLEEIGVVYGVTRERIRQIESSAIRKLKHPAKAKYLRGYADVRRPKAVGARI
jgi:RNA polymerase primary sigma factor